MDIKLGLPLRHIFCTQPFGSQFYQNDKKFYGEIVPGLIAHNGLDFRAFNGFECYAAHDGVVTWAGEDAKGGISINLTSTTKGEGFYTVYYHLKSVMVKVGDKVNRGRMIGECDNTGIYTTRSHLHFGLKRTFNGATINKDNGYGGAIDPSPYFYWSSMSNPISPKDWDKPRAYHRYNRNEKRNLANEMKVALYLARRLKRLPKNEEINAAIWGGWNIEAIMNPAMYEIWSQLKKSEYLAGEKPFQAL